MRKSAAGFFQEVRGVLDRMAAGGELAYELLPEMYAVLQSG